MGRETFLYIYGEVGYCVVVESRMEYEPATGAASRNTNCLAVRNSNSSGVGLGARVVGWDGGGSSVGDLATVSYCTFRTLRSSYVTQLAVLS
jgi:hypothetical protein